MIAVPETVEGLHVRYDHKNHMVSLVSADSKFISTCSLTDLRHLINLHRGHKYIRLAFAMERHPSVSENVDLPTETLQRAVEILSQIITLFPPSPVR